MKLTKQDVRLRRALRGRVKIKELAALRLSVHRTPQHIYAQIFAAEGDKVLVAASTLQKDVRGDLKVTGHRGTRQGQGHRQGRLRPLRLHVPRARQSAGRGRARSRSRVLIFQRSGK
jgi:hypothetical protein